MWKAKGAEIVDCYYPGIEVCDTVARFGLVDEVPVATEAHDG